jgi:hypothetical protein
MNCLKTPLSQFLKAGASIVVTCLLSAITLYGQVAGGSISGKISDPSGAVLPGATVTVKNLLTGIVREGITTNSDGIYVVPNLAPAKYELTVKANGFEQYVVRDVEITVGAELKLDASLTIGTSDQKVEVSGTAPGVELTNSTISELVDAGTIVELPLNGRSWTDLATLQPGVVGVKTQLALPTRAQHGFGTELTIAGGRPQQNNYRLNGISIADFSNAAPGDVIGVAMGVDAIQEFSVLTSNYSAAYGRTSGGVVNAITRAGTNQFHGSAYEFLRNSALDSRGYFDKSLPPFKRNQFGGSLGGPIIKDHTFFFFDYEGLRQSLGLTLNDIVPSPAAVAGNLAAGTVVVDPVVARYLKAFYPSPNNGLLGNGDTGSFLITGQQIVPENYYTARIDHKFSAADSLNGAYVDDSSNTTQPDEFNAKRIALRTGQRVVTLEESHTFGPQLLNSARLGYTRSRGEDGDVATVFNPAMNDPTFGFQPGFDVGLLQVTGMTSLTGGANGAGIAPHRFVQNSVQGYDDIIWSRGTHVLSFGANVENLRVNSLVASFPGGFISFSSLANFLTNHPFQAAFGIQAPTERGMRQTIFGSYVQDDWRMRPNLTVNLGLRYEMSTVPSEEHGKLATLLNITDPQPHLGNPYFSNPTLRNFEPKIGLAWDPRGDGRTSVRSAFGIFDVLPLPYLFQVVTPFAAPFYLQANLASVPAGSFPTGAYQFATTQNNLYRMSYVQPNPGRDYVMVWNLNIQHDFSHAVHATIAYVGSRGVHQPWTNNDGDMVVPAITPQGLVWPSKATSQKINPNFGRIAMKLWVTNSYYHALQTRLTARSHGFDIQGSYTFAKSIDDSSASEADNSFANSIGNPYWFAPQTNKGLSDFDQRHTFVVHGMWTVPTPAAFSHTYSSVMFGGWKLGGIYTFSTGVPFNMFISGDVLGVKSNQNSELPNRVPGCGPLTTGNPAAYVNTACLAFPNPTNIPGNIGRNAFTGPSLSDLDASLTKDNHLREWLSLQLRFEVFNLLNHPNFGPPISNGTAFDGSGNRIATAGRLDQLQTPARQIQLGVKFLW